jgi:hypothetical protein
MHKIGILVLSLFFLSAGAMLGDNLLDLLHGKLARILKEPGLLWFSLIANPVCWLCIWLLWRKARQSDPMQFGDSRLTFSRLVLRGLPLTDRLAFLTFSITWVLGFLLGFVVPFFDRAMPR